MEEFKIHPDLTLLGSLYRELTSDLHEAAEAKAGLEGVLVEVNVDPLSIVKFSEAMVARMGMMMQATHPEGAPCAHTLELWEGMYMEAFVMGSRYAHEKHEWALAKGEAGPTGSGEAPAQPA